MRTKFASLLGFILFFILTPRKLQTLFPIESEGTGLAVISPIPEIDLFSRVLGGYRKLLNGLGGAAYCAAKAGELQISRALRLELSGTGIRVSSVDPGLAETEFSLVRFKGDVTRAKKPYEGTHPLVAQDIAEILVWVASRPAHVNIDEMLIKPVDQAAMHKVYRRTAVSKQ